MVGISTVSFGVLNILFGYVELRLLRIIWGEAIDLIVKDIRGANFFEMFNVCGLIIKNM